MMIKGLRLSWIVIALIAFLAAAAALPVVLLGIGIARNIPSSDIPIMIGIGILSVAVMIGVLVYRRIRQFSSESAVTGEALEVKLEQEGS